MLQKLTAWLHVITNKAAVRSTAKTGENRAMQETPPPAAQPRNPLHGVTLEAIVLALEARYGWAGLARQVPVRCFALDPSVSSSLKFLRKTPWAREKVEALYLEMLRKDRPRPASKD
ncbi:DNA-binding protein VF530 [Delftia tsuruhatensis]|nr:DNA-binding protein VF530 [Delftia tsuruhatensis]